MARTKKLWRPIRVWRPHEWVSFNKTWQRVERVISSENDVLWLMQHDLRQEFLDGQLTMAVRLFTLDGTETMRIMLEPACWQWLSINFATSITGWETIPGWAADPHNEEEWDFRVRRRELDELYPEIDPTGPAGATGPVGAMELGFGDAANDGRGTPGPRAKSDWPEHVTREVIRRLLAGEKYPSAPAMLQWCQNKAGFEPDQRQMQRHLLDLKTPKTFSAK
jgi:hypothetical protein